LEYRPLSVIFHLFVLLIVPPFFAGVINRVKSIFAGRKGPPLFQLYFDIFKLLKKDAVYSRSTSYIFQFAPLVVLVSAVCAGAIIPLTGNAPIHFYGDIILFAYFFALSRFFMVIAALDTASSFGGMGASREAAFGAFSELTTFIVIIALAIITRSLSLDKIFTGGGPYLIAKPSIILLFITFFFILLTENSRMPVDDPNTHLELTMIHEVIMLDYSGPDLGLMLYAASMKLFIFMAFAAMLISSDASHGMFVGTALLLLKITVLAVIIGVVESVTARVRLIRIPQLLIVSFVLSVFALLVALFMKGVL